ncbi:MAG: glycosyltransferase family 2 protein [Fimbriimonadaceae bacterium]
MTWLLCIVYGVLALIAAGNWLLMRRPKPPHSSEQPAIAVLIPARDEELNLARLIAQLKTPNPTLQIFVYDDESTDRTAEVAVAHGVNLIRGEPLPEGWTGKNRACHVLAEHADATSGAEWFLFLDADVRPTPDFIPALRGMLTTLRPGVKVLTGFPQILPGRGVEPLFLGWVGWVLLATNPFGLAARTGLGHSQFTNGQATLWRREVYTELWPNRQVRSAILEDVLIGRLLKRRKIGLEVANFASVMQVRMYETWRQTLDGMSKNSYEITGNIWGSVAVALLLFLLAWGWLAVPMWWAPLLLLGLSGLFPAFTCRANPAALFVMPIVLTLGGITVLRSIYWRKKHKVTWKGRTYSP